MNEKTAQIPEEEGYLVEFKDFSGGLSGKELAITLTSFANTDGGDIYLGVTDSRQIKGLNLTPVLLDQIQNAAREGCSPPVPITLNKFPVTQKRAVIKISAEKSGRLHSTASGQTYIRVGTQDKRILGDELLRLAETKSQVSYEDEFLGAGMEVIDQESLNEYYMARRAVSPLRENLKPEDFLIKMGLAKYDKNILKIKAAAFILFGKVGETLLLQRDFTFVRYDVEGKMYSYREDISLPAARTVDRLMELIRPLNKITTGIKGVKRQEAFCYPEEAMREAILNALAHRDWRLSGLKNECRWYPDRLEIISPGGLPSIITLENIDQRHYSRNPKIMHAFLILGLTEELGQGISLIKKELKKNNNPPPDFIAHHDQFKVVFRKPKGKGIKKDFRGILDYYFSSHQQITRRQMEAVLNIGATRAKYLIQDLLREGFLEQEGKGPSTRYKKHQTS